MIDIDFLPEKYRERCHVRLQRLWRLSVTVLFTSIVVGVSLLQHWLKKDAEHRLESLTATHVESLKINRRLANLYQELDRQKNEAALFTYLRHAWPTTQLLQQALSPLEPGIHFNRIELSTRQSHDRSVNRSEGTRSRRSGAKKDHRPAAIQDLDLLRARYGERIRVLELSGWTADLEAFHRYVGKLTLSPMFERVEITRLESTRNGEETGSGITEFRVTIEIEPGPGQSSPQPAAAGRQQALVRQRNDSGGAPWQR